MIRRWALVILLFCFCAACSHSQNGNSELLKEAEKDLRSDKTSVSTILSTKKYEPIHPETAFRELIKLHTTTEPLLISFPEEPGKKIRVLATIKNEAGEPLPNILVYMYQTDTRGWYSADRPHVGGNEGDRRHARLFGYVKTDKNGQFELHTIKPSGYPQSDLPAHIHVEILEPEGYKTIITEFLFDDDERLVREIRSQSIRYKFPIAKPEKTFPPFDQQFTYNIILQR